MTDVKIRKQRCGELRENRELNKLNSAVEFICVEGMLGYAGEVEFVDRYLIRDEIFFEAVYCSCKTTYLPLSLYNFTKGSVETSNSV